MRLLAIFKILVISIFVPVVCFAATAVNLTVYDTTDNGSFPTVAVTDHPETIGFSVPSGSDVTSAKNIKDVPSDATSFTVTNGEVTGELRILKTDGTNYYAPETIGEVVTPSTGQNPVTPSSDSALKLIGNAKDYVYMSPELQFDTTSEGTQSGVTLISGDAASTDILVYFWPVNYSASQETTFAQDIDDWINASTGKLWETGWFDDNKDRFTFYKVEIAGVWDKNYTELKDMLDDVEGGQFRDSATNRVIPVMIDNDDNLGGGYTMGDGEGGTASYVLIQSNYASLYHTLAHEIGVHVIGRGGEPGVMQLRDTYDPACNVSETMYFINLSDVNSNEKWADFQATSLTQCSSYGIWFPAPDLSTNAGLYSDFGDAASDFLDKALDKRTQNNADSIAPTLSSVAVSNDTNISVSRGIPQTAYDEDFTITANVSDAIGVKQVEWYIKVDDGNYDTLCVDRTSPYTCDVDISDHTQGLSYTIRTLVIDDWYNITMQSDWIHFFTRLGEGCTSAYFIDRDCDGYGVGRNYLAGGDADDKDDMYNTLSSVEAAYGDLDGCTGTDETCATNLKTWLAARTDTPYTWKGDVYYVDGTSQTCVANRVQTPCNSPSAGNDSYSARDAGAGADDIIVVRGGTYYEHTRFNADCTGLDTPYGCCTDVNAGTCGTNYWYNTSYASGSELLIIAMPGEQPVLRHGPVNAFWWNEGTLGGVIIDGIILDASDTSNLTGGALYMDGSIKNSDNFEFRNMEISHHNGAFRFHGPNDNHIYEYNVIYDLGSELHMMYDSCKTGDDNFCSGNVFRGNIYYASDPNLVAQLGHWGGYPNAAWNGLLIERNIFHSGDATAIELEGNLKGTVIQNNIVFNTNSDAIRYLNYGSGHDVGANDWIIQGNTFFMGDRNNGIGVKDPSLFSAITIYEDSEDAHGIVANRMTIRNNIFYLTDQAPGFISGTNMNNIADWTIENNIVYKSGGDTIVATVDGIAKTSAQFDAYDSVRGMTYKNPNLIDVSTTYDYSEAARFSLKIDATSTNAIDAGSTTNPLSVDITNTKRSSPPDIGAYEY